MKPNIRGAEGLTSAVTKRVQAMHGIQMQRVHRAMKCHWRKILSSRSWKGEIWWKKFHEIKERLPLLRPKLFLPYTELQAIALL